MQRTLWLKFEKPPHPEAVVHPANQEELRLVLAVLGLPHRERCHLSGLLRNWLKGCETQSPFDRPRVAVRFGDGLYQVVPWRLAKWLASVLPISDSGACSTRQRIRHWLESENKTKIIMPE